MEARARNPRGEGDRLRTTLLDVATELLAEVHDVDQLSVRAVTSAAGVSPTALYLHFADKDELVTAIKLRCFAALKERLDAAMAERDGDPLSALRAAGHAYLAFAREQPGWYAAIFHTNFRKDVDPGEYRLGGDGMETFAVLVTAVASCLGRPEDEDAFAIATILWTALHGRASVTRAMPGFPFPDERSWIERLVSGMVDAGAAAGDRTAGSPAD
ncbi:TetR/AcrR family transcriptional regulator [Patulibacter medicamentivorans]|nr:TetR/AcrR family transcriptional regulator [Patulibacter medicamentivorans]